MLNMSNVTMFFIAVAIVFCGLLTAACISSCMLSSKSSRQEERHQEETWQENSKS